MAVVDWRKDTGTGREDAPFRDEPKAGMAISDDSGGTATIAQGWIWSQAVPHSERSLLFWCVAGLVAIRLHDECVTPPKTGGDLLESDILSVVEWGVARPPGSLRPHAGDE